VFDLVACSEETLPARHGVGADDGTDDMG
jgi:hypothetical protein